MRETILFNNDWRFHEGDIDTSIPVRKAPLYISAKTERAKWGPATIYYRDVPDDYCTTAELNNRDVWDNVTLPHDYVILHTPEEKYKKTLGYLPGTEGILQQRKKREERDLYSILTVLRQMQQSTSTEAL